MCVYMYIYMYVCMYIYMCVCIYICICVCVHGVAPEIPKPDLAFFSQHIFPKLGPPQRHTYHSPGSEEVVFSVGRPGAASKFAMGKSMKRTAFIVKSSRNG